MPSRFLREIQDETDRAGFEPAVPLTRYVGLANRCLQPLGHLSRGRDHSRSGRGVQSLIVTETRSCVPPAMSSRPRIEVLRTTKPFSSTASRRAGDVDRASLAVQQWTPRVPVSRESSIDWLEHGMTTAATTTSSSSRSSVIRAAWSVARIAIGCDDWCSAARESARQTTRTSEGGAIRRISEPIPEGWSVREVWGGRIDMVSVRSGLDMRGNGRGDGLCPSEERGEHADGNIEAFAASPDEAVAQAVKSLEGIMHRVEAGNMSF